MTGVVALVVGAMIGIVVCGVVVLKEERVRGSVVFQGMHVETIGSFVRDIGEEAMSVIVVIKGRHTRKHRGRTLVSSVPETLMESHLWWKVLSTLQAVVKVDLVVIPDCPNTKVFLNWIRMVKMIWDEKIAVKVFRKVVTRVVEMEKV